MATLEENINQAISDFDDIEAAIVEKGVDVPKGTDTSEYGNLIRSIPQEASNITVDQNYDPESANAQSGTAVAEAISPIERATAENENAIKNIRETIATDKGLYANTVKATAGGEVIRVDDVSPIEHTVKAKIGRARNIIPFPYYSKSRTANGVTITVNTDGTITLNGTCTGSAVGFPLFVGSMPLNGKYTLSGVSNSDETTHYLQPYVDGAFQASVANGAKTYEIKGNLTQISLFIKSGFTFDNVVVYPQFEEGDTSTEYEPYIDPTDVTVTRCGKNILPYPFFNKTKTENGVTFTDNGNGTLTVNGTAEDNAFFHFIINSSIRVKGTYTLSGLTGGSGTTYYIQPFVDGGALRGLTSGSITYDLDGNLDKITMVVTKGTTLTNLIVKLQMERSETATPFEVYNVETYTPAADGTCEIVSVSPTMTLLTNTAGVNIDVEYNQDTNIAMGNVKEDLKTIDNTIAQLVMDMGDTETALDNIIAIQASLIGGENA